MTPQTLANRPSSVLQESMENGLQTLLIHLPVLIIAVILHECAHGYVAKKWGDNTAEAAGRLTLNPVPHIDPIGTLIFPGALMLMGVPTLFGWAKPVPIDPNQFRKYRPGLFWVSFAGPLTNIGLAIISAILFCVLVGFVPTSFYLHEPLTRMAQISVYINFILAAFNMIPIPPLDGSKMIMSFMGYEATRKYESLGAYSFWILMALIFTGGIRIFLMPAYHAGGFLLKFMMTLFGLSYYAG